MAIELTLMKKKNLFKDLNEVPQSDDWFPYEYIDAEVKKKIDENKRQLAGDEMKKETKHYVESINHDPNWLNKISIEIDKLFTNCKYIEFFIEMYIQWNKDDGYTSSFRTLIIPHLPCFEKLSLSKFRVYIETDTMTHFLFAVILKRLFSFDMPKLKKGFFVFYTC